MTDIHEKLYDASGGGDRARVGELLAAGADPNKYKDCVGDTALLEATYRGKYSIVSLLIEHGAALDTQNKKGNNALHCAAERGNNLIVSLLINSGADLSVQNIDGNINSIATNIDGITGLLVNQLLGSITDLTGCSKVEGEGKESALMKERKFLTLYMQLSEVILLVGKLGS